MLIGLHDADRAQFKHGKTFPNYALMKISAYHKAQGDTVEWWLQKAKAVDAAQMEIDFGEMEA